MSLYSGKVRAYLRHRNILPREKRPRLGNMREINRRVGAKVIPVVATPAGRVAAGHVRDHRRAENALPEVSGAAGYATPPARDALLLEAWGKDEFGCRARCIIAGTSRRISS